VTPAPAACVAREKALVDVAVDEFAVGEDQLEASSAGPDVEPLGERAEQFVRLSILDCEGGRHRHLQEV
jgi:hypothetical protein